MSTMKPEASRPPPASFWAILLCTAMALLSAIIYGIVFLLTPSFANLYAGFGADLPMLTRIYLGSGPWLIVLAILGFAPSILLALNRTAQQHVRNLFVGSSIGSLLLSVAVFVGWIVASYLPIWKMGATVQ